MLKCKSYEFHNRNIGIFSGNDTRMSGYFIEMHRYLCTINKTIKYVIIFDEASNVRLGGELMKFIDPNSTVMHGVEHTVTLFFNDISMVLIVNNKNKSYMAI